MDKAIESLVQDHWVLRRALNALEALSREALESNGVNRKDLRQFADFLKFYGDVHHAEKEEVVLFPLLSNAGVGQWDVGPLADARREHRQERYLMRVLEHYASRDGEFGAERVRELTNEIDELLASMRRHLAFEEEHIFPLVADLSEAQRTELRDRLQQFDQSPPSVQQCDPMREVLTELAARYSW